MDSIQQRLEQGLRDRYQVEREIGRGGMATVYLARDLKHQRRVAIKVLRPDLTEAIGPERFLREIEIAAQLEHPHVLTLIDSGEADGLLYFVMPFIEGESLRARLVREGRLPVVEAARLFREIVDGLAHAHGQGVVHRDIKPDNVLLSGRHAVITDFGVAKALSAATGQHAVTTVGMSLGTPAYMAPEQAAADPNIDHRVDLYAAGVVAYELLAGRPPFVADTPQAVLMAQVTHTPDPITAHRPDTPPALAEVVMRCLEKRPEDRWASADELLGRLDAVVGAIETTPTGAAAVASTSQRRRRTMAWAAVGVAVVAILALAFRGRTPAPASGPADRPTIVVLPFENIGNTDNEYFADGITQEITSRLGAVPELGVVARTSAIQYRGTTKTIRQIGDELAVRYVLNGTVQWQRNAGGSDRVRIIPTLVAVPEGTQLWTARYDEVLADIFKVQSDVAENVARALNLQLAGKAASPSAPTANLEAYDAYLQANNVFWRGFDGPGYQRAAGLYERAVALDSNFAQAYAMLSQTHAEIYWFGFDASPRRLELARVAAERSVALVPGLAEGHQALASYFYRLRDYDRAMTEIRIAEATLPNESGVAYQIGNIHRRLGRFTEALGQYRRGFQLDQRNVTMAHTVGSTSMYVRQYDDALRHLQLAASIQADWPHPQVYAIWTRLARGDDPKAVAPALRELDRRLQPSPVIATVDDLWPWWTARILARHDPGIAPIFTRRFFGVDSLSYYLTGAELATLAGDGAGARAYYDSVRVLLEADRVPLPNPGIRHSLLSVALAGLGRAPEALREAARAAEAMPVSRDALWGTAIKGNLALVYARVGDTDRAVATLGELLAAPGPLSPSILRVDPAWDRLRADERFRRLVGPE